MYLLKRMLGVVLSLSLLTLLPFGMRQFLPGGPLEGMSRLGNDRPLSVSSEQLENWEKQNSLHGPWHERYANWFRGVIRGDWGNSFYYGEPVTKVISRAAKPTLWMSGLAIFFIYLIAIPLGVAFAARPNSWWERFASFFLLLLYSLPMVWIGTFLIFVFAVKLGWFPLQGIQGEDFQTLSLAGKVVDFSRHFFLPVLCFVLAGVGPVSFLVKNTLSEELSQDHLMAARARGNTERRLLWNHAFRRVLSPLATSLGSQIAFLLTGTVFVEILFGVSGFGRLAYDSLLRRDYPVILAVLFLFGALQVIGNCVSDFLYHLVDPRVRIA